jgi:hypothetical protein
MARQVSCRCAFVSVGAKHAPDAGVWPVPGASFGYLQDFFAADWTAIFLG